MTIREKVTVTSIARHIGVSTSTVSSVLRGDAEKIGISKKTASRVSKAAKSMGYVPNLNARSLRSQKSKVISLLFTDLLMDWADTVLQGVSEVLQANGYRSFIGVDRSKRSYLDNEIDSVLARGDSGVICHSYIIREDDILRLRNNGVSVVMISDLPEELAQTDQISTVIWNERPAIESALARLAQKGYEKIAFLGHRHGVVSDLKRYEGFRSGLSKNGLHYDEQFEYWLDDYTDIPDLCGRLAEGDRPDAIFALNDFIAVNMLHGLRAKGIDVPEQIAIMGIGNLPISEYIGLSSIEEPLLELGKQSAQLVLDVIRDSANKVVHTRIDSNKILFRQTT